MQPAIYTIPLGMPLTTSVARGLLHQYKDNLLALSDVQLYLPDRSAIRLMREAFLQVSDGKATMLPQMIPIASGDEEDLFALDPLSLGEDPHLIRSIEPLERQMLLTQMIMRRQDITLSPAQAFALADDLARLLDQAIMEDVALNKIERLVEGDLALHWQKTMQFLSIIQSEWPRVLEERREHDPSTRRKILLKKKIQSLQKKHTTNPVIAIAPYQSDALSLKFLETIARLKNGAVLLAGFAPDYPMDYWQNIDCTHPYYTAKQLLDACEYQPINVKLWPVLQPHPAHHGTGTPARSEIIQHALQPATHYNLTNAFLKNTDLGPITFCLADNVLHEARTISLLLRQVLDTPGKTALVVTQDRQLARAIQGEMRRWDITLADDGAIPAAQTSLGLFMRLILCLSEGHYPVSGLLSLMRHSLFKVMNADTRSDAINRLDLDCLRGAFSVEKIFQLTLENTDTGLQELYSTVIQHLSFTQETQPRSLFSWLTDHLQCTEALGGGAENIWQGTASEAIAKHFIALLNVQQSHEWLLTITEYCDFFNQMIEKLSIKPDTQTHPRLRITTPHEALWHDADLFILSGLNEKTWPQASTQDAWLSHHMRQSIGFSDANAAIGHAAHSFATLFCQNEIALTWAHEREGNPALPARWLQQIFSVLDKNKIDYKQYYSPAISWAYIWDQPRKLTPRLAPEPKPDIAVRPRKLSVSDIRNWLNDPYSLYAHRILDVSPADPIDHAISHREWGSLVHKIIENFLPQIGHDDSYQRCIACIDDELNKLSIDPLQRMRWRQQLQHIGMLLNEYYRNQQKEQRQEQTGKIIRRVGDTEITLHGRADLISIENNEITITDFKTGKVPSEPDVINGKEPQLAILGMIARENGFKNIDARFVTELSYLSVKGKRSQKLEKKTLKNSDEIIESIDTLLNQYLYDYYHDNKDYGVLKTGPQRHDTYEHLKRNAEWGLPGDDQAEGENDE